MDKVPWGVWPITAWDSAAGRNVITLCAVEGRSVMEKFR